MLFQTGSSKVCLQTSFLKSGKKGSENFHRVTLGKCAAMTSLNISGAVWWSPYCRQKDLLLGGRSTGDVRNFLNVVHWMLRTGSPWRALPKEYWSWRTVYLRFRSWQRRWRVREFLEKILEDLIVDPDFEMQAISKFIRMRRALWEVMNPWGAKRGLSSKTHLVMEAYGMLVRALLHNATVQIFDKHTFCWRIESP